VTWETSMVLWCITTTGTVVAGFWKLKSEIKLLDATKETKNGLHKSVEEIKESQIRVEEAIKYLPCKRNDPPPPEACTWVRNPMRGQ
jgi:hypothetical protein